MSHLSVLMIFLEVFYMFFFQYQMSYYVVSKKKNTYSCEDGIERSVPHDHHLWSLDKHCDANWWFLGWIFFYRNLTLMMDSYNPSQVLLWDKEIPPENPNKSSSKSIWVRGWDFLVPQQYIIMDTFFSPIFEVLYELYQFRIRLCSNRKNKFNNEFWSTNKHSLPPENGSEIAFKHWFFFVALNSVTFFMH